jgi:hypothetical protein
MRKIDDRHYMPDLLDELGLHGIYVEIGVDRGTYSQLFVNKGVYSKYYLIDPWLHAHVENPDCWNQHDLDISYETVKKRFEKDSRVVLIRDLSVCASKKFVDNSLDFVYIDALHDFNSVYEDMSVWFPKVKIGGMFAGHDYVATGNRGVIEAVDRFTKENNISNFDVTAKDSDPFYTWYWVKQ